MFRKTCKAMATVAALSALVMVSQAGAADKLVVKDTAGTNTVFRVDDAGMVIGSKLGMGTTTPQAPLHLNLPTALGVLNSAGTALYNVSTGSAFSTQDNSVQADFVVADGTAPGTPGYRGIIRGVRARGSLASPSIPQADDQVLSLLGGVWTGARVSNAADIVMKVDGTISEGGDGTQGTVTAPLRIVFQTRPYGWTWYERMAIKSDGKIGVATSTPTALFDVNSDGIRVRSSKTPASAIAACNQGDISWDSNYIYVCVSNNSWRRSTLASW